MSQRDTLRGLQSLINSSRSKVIACPRRGKAHTARELLAIAGSSVLGCVIDQTGGLVVADGFIKHLGGDNACDDDLATVNGLLGDVGESVPTRLGALVVAVDAFGGLFVIPSDVTDPSQATVRYLPYDSIVWEDFSIGHGDFVAWSMGEAARALYPDGERTELSRGQVVMRAPALWEPSSGVRVTFSTMCIARLVAVRVGLSCAVAEATRPDGGGI